MDDLVIHGDVESAAVAVLLASSEVAALHPDGISTSLVGYVRGQLWVTVARTGGVVVSQSRKVDRPRVDFVVTGQKRSQTLQLISTIQGVMLRDSQNYTGNGLRMCAATVETGITKLDDKIQDLCVYVLSLRLTCVPH